MTPINLILFDINGVLYRYDKAARIAHLAPLTHRTPETIDDAIWGSGLEDDGDAGRLDAPTYLRRFGDALGRDLTLDDWRAALQASLTPDEPMLSLAASLSSRARLAALTNNNLLVRDEFHSLFPRLEPLFGEAILVSSSLGARKPDPAIYSRSLDALGAAPATTLFIDDSEANTDGARDAGLQANHFTGRPRLEAHLRALAFPPPP